MMNDQTKRDLLRAYRMPEAEMILLQETDLIRTSLNQTDVDYGEECDLDELLNQ